MSENGSWLLVKRYALGVPLQMSDPTSLAGRFVCHESRKLCLYSLGLKEHEGTVPLQDFESLVIAALLERFIAHCPHRVFSCRCCNSTGELNSARVPLLSPRPTGMAQTGSYG